jgi:hypothetical protein
MARSFSLLGLSNMTTSSTVTVTPLDLKPYSGFGLDVDNGGICTLTNNSSPLDAVAKLSYMAEDVARVANGMKLPYGKVDPAVHVTVKYEDVIRETDSSDASIIVDHPITCQLSMRVPKISAITDPMIRDMIAAVIGATYQTDGTSRITFLLRSSLRPKQD